MGILIRIVFVIFIANGVDCLGSVCDNCCDCCDCFNCFNKKKAKSLVNEDWYDHKEGLVLKIFKKEKTAIYNCSFNDIRYLIFDHNKKTSWLLCHHHIF